MGDVRDDGGPDHDVPALVDVTVDGDVQGALEERLDREAMEAREATLDEARGPSVERRRDEAPTPSECERLAKKVATGSARPRECIAHFGHRAREGRRVSVDRCERRDREASVVHVPKDVERWRVRRNGAGGRQRSEGARGRAPREATG